MPQLSVRCLLSTTLLAATACSPLSASTEREGPEIVLTAAEPSVEYAVTLCIDSAKVKSVTPSAFVNADLEVVQGETGMLVGERSDSDTEYQRDELELAAAADDRMSFELDAEGPWEGESGRRCSEAQIVRFSYAGEDEMAELRVTWSVHFTTDYSDGLAGRDDLFDEDLSIEIEPVQ